MAHFRLYIVLCGCHNNHLSETVNGKHPYLTSTEEGIQGQTELEAKLGLEFSNLTFNNSTAALEEQ